MENLFCVVAILALMAVWQSGETAMMSKSRICMRYPTGTKNPPTPGDNGYQVRVTEIGRYRLIRRFRPGRTYEVVIRSIHPFVNFKKFYLTAVVDKKEKKSQMNSTSSQAGNFVHMANPPVTTNVDQCPGVITTINDRLMDKVKLRWTAPLFARDCIMFKATVEKRSGVYFMDDGMLTQTVCPQYIYASDEESPEKMPVSKPPTIKDCCACGTATYKMKFQGKWIRQLHPRDWPKNDGFAHWTSIIGATHNQDYFIYHLGGLASAGVQSVCQFGDAGVLEGEFKRDAGSNVLNIIKTRGIIGGANLGESRTAIFAVNRTHHLMSMLAMLGPSPDWCAGVSAQDLCKSGCTWVENITLDLYPWDAGVRQGNTYMPKEQRMETPRKPIMPITPEWPRGNPFTVVNGKIRPVATVTIERLSPKKDYQCDKKAMPGVRKFKSTQNDDEEQFGRPSKSGRTVDETKNLAPNLRNMIPTMCFMTPWSPWSPCSVTCGSGVTMRTRTMKRNLKPALCTKVKLKEKTSCVGSQRTCNYDKLCSVTQWSTWSPCNATCKSEGVVLRTRSFIRIKEKPRCSHVKTMESQNCVHRCDATITCSEPMVEGFNCYNPKIRYYYNLRKKACLPFTYLGCKGSKNRFKSEKDCHRVCDNAFEFMPKWKISRTAQLQEDATRRKMLASKGKSSMSCKQPMDEGHRCRRRKRRKGKNEKLMYWYFNKKEGKCKKLMYKGCAGNKNNFESETDCKTTCRKYMKVGRVITGPPQDCKVGRWGPWGPCQSKCGGRRRRIRRVIQAPQNGGKRCPRLFEFGLCPRTDCSPCVYTQWSDWSACTTTCGGGVKERTRTRLPTSPKECTPIRPEFTDRNYCNTKPCPIRLFHYRNV